MSANKKEGADMNDREQLILKAIIKHYLEFGESVGSRTLEKKYSIGVSSATIRNTMADLEDKEFRQVKDINYMWRNLLR